MTAIRADAFHARSASMVTGALFAVCAASRLLAQPCIGLPERGGVAYEYQPAGLGKTNGIDAGYSFGHFSMDGGFRVRNAGATRKAKGADLRFAFPFPISRIQLCPHFGLGYGSTTNSVFEQTTISDRSVSARGGVGIGIEQPVYRNFTIIPFLSVRYEFILHYMDTKTTVDANTEATGDTASRFDIQYGLTMRYRWAWAGWALERNADSKGKRPYAGRLLLGATFDGPKPRGSSRPSGAAK